MNDFFLHLVIPQDRKLNSLIFVHLFHAIQEAKAATHCRLFS